MKTCWILVGMACVSLNSSPCFAETKVTPPQEKSAIDPQKDVPGQTEPRGTAPKTRADTAVDKAMKKAPGKYEPGD